MSVSRRRGHLFGIFYYRTLDARRIDKMMMTPTRRRETEQQEVSFGEHNHT
jgi:hypothetical protein